MCMNASAQPMPDKQKAKKQARAIPKYTVHSPRAVSAMRGVSFWSFSGPAVSLLS
jgi:hypothetical protein